MRSTRRYANISRALAEGRLLATLEHRGLVRVFDVGVFEGRPYLVLEYVPGRTLEQCYERERPKPSEAARLACEVAQVLAYAHSRGVTHGDVTPRNVMIDAEGRARLIDFGLARLEHIWRDDSEAGGGTPAFLAPELLLPDSERHVGPAADVFGLGATLYWLLTGRGPFEAPTILESLALARRAEIDVVALRAARLPRRLLRLCEQTLAQDPAARPTAAQCARRLGLATKRLPALRTKAALIVILLVALLVMELVGRRSKKSIVLSVPDVIVLRDNVPVNLKSVLPLRTGDEIMTRFVVAPGEEVTTVWLDAAGQVHRLDTDRAPDEEVDRIRYPARDHFALATEPEGTDMIFVCRGTRISDGDLQACFLDRPPPIPDQVFLQLQRLSEVVPMGPIPPHSEAAAQVAKAEEHMRAIDARLRRHFEGVRGIAFAHRGPLNESDGAKPD